MNKVKANYKANKKFQYSAHIPYYILGLKENRKNTFYFFHVARIKKKIYGSFQVKNNVFWQNAKPTTFLEMALFIKVKLPHSVRVDKN